MEAVIFTRRLKLVLIQTVERGSQELEWLHTIRSNEQATWWSVHGKSGSIEDTEKLAKNYVSSNDKEYRTHRIVYAVHELPELVQGSNAVDQISSTSLIGLVALLSVDDQSLPLPDHLTLPSALAAATNTLVVDMGYGFLPSGSGKGYATEAVRAVLDVSKRTPSFCTPYSKLYVRALVNEENPRSRRVMDKCGMVEKGVYAWSGEPIWLAGEWRSKGNIHIYGMYLIE